MLFLFLCLISLNMILSVSKRFRSFFMTIHLKIFFLSLYLCVCASHIFFIHSSIDRHSCSHIVAIVNNAAVNIGVRILFE